MQKLIDNPQQFDKLIQEIKLDPNYSINKCIKHAEIIRCKINAADSISISKKTIANVYKTLFTQFLKINFTNAEEFFTHFQEYERVIKLLQIICYYICQNLRAKLDFDFYQLAITKYAIFMQNHINQYIIDFLQKQYEDIIKAKEKQQLIVNFQKYCIILLKLQLNDQNLIQQRNINNDNYTVKVFENLSQKLLLKIEQIYSGFQKQQFYSQSMSQYFFNVNTEIELNQKIFSFITPEFQPIKIKITRVIYETLLMKCQEEILNKNRPENMFNLLDDFLKNCKNEQDTSKNRELIIIIIKLYSIFDDKREYFLIFKSSFQTFIQESIQKQYIQATVNYELQRKKQKCKSLVVIVCEIFSYYNQLIKQCLRPNEEYQYKGRYDLEMAINIELSLFFKNLDKTIGLTKEFCSYTDQLILEMVTSESPQQDEINKDSIQNVLEIMQPYMNDTEFYLLQFKYMLASRLIYYFIFTKKEHQIYQMTQERFMLDSIQKYCGSNKVKKIIKMFKESDNLIEKKQEYLIDGETVELIELNERKWPKLYDNDEKVFQLLNDKKSQLIGYYQKNRDQHKIRFSDTLSYVEIYWKKVKKTLYLNCVQASILFLYDLDDEAQTIDQISEALGLPTQQIKTQIDRMVHQKIFWVDSDLYHLNEAQINLDVDKPVICLDYNIYENQDEIQKYIQNNNSDQQDVKKSLITAMIVKILKKKKQISHLELFDQVKDSLYPRIFTNQEFKESIEYLLTNVYLRREKQQNQSQFQNDLYFYE